MKKFTCVQDIGDLKSALAEAFEIKKERFKYVELGRNKTLMMIFFNSSLRTRRLRPDAGGIGPSVPGIRHLRDREPWQTDKGLCRMAGRA